MGPFAKEMISVELTHSCQKRIFGDFGDFQSGCGPN